MRSKIAILYLVLLALGGSSLHAQGLKSYIRRANKLYQAKDYAGATQEYRRALLRDSLSGKANFGISAAAYGQGRYDEAKDYLERAAQDPRLTPRQQAGVSCTTSVMWRCRRRTIRVPSSPMRKP